MYTDDLWLSFWTSLPPPPPVLNSKLLYVSLFPVFWGPAYFYLLSYYFITLLSSYDCSMWKESFAEFLRPHFPLQPEPKWHFWGVRWTGGNAEGFCLPSFRMFSFNATVVLILYFICSEQMIHKVLGWSTVAVHLKTKHNTFIFHLTSTTTCVLEGRVTTLLFYPFPFSL